MEPTCRDQWLLVRRSKALQTPQDPSHIPKKSLKMLDKGLETLSDPGFYADTKQ